MQPPPPEAVEAMRQANCPHMVLGRVREGSPVLVCGQCPTIFLMFRTGSFVAIPAGDADLLARDLVGIKRLDSISQELATPQIIVP